MRRMCDPQYVYTPWTDGRRKRASEAAKARWAAQSKAPPAREAAKASFRDKFATASHTHQHDLIEVWWRLILLYRQSPSDPEFMNMLADRWEDMAALVAEDMRRPRRRDGRRRC